MFVIPAKRGIDGKRRNAVNTVNQGVIGEPSIEYVNSRRPGKPPIGVRTVKLPPIMAVAGTYV